MLICWILYWKCLKLTIKITESLSISAQERQRTSRFQKFSRDMERLHSGVAIFKFERFQYSVWQINLSFYLDLGRFNSYGVKASHLHPIWSPILVYSTPSTHTHNKKNGSICPFVSNMKQFTIVFGRRG